MIQGKKAQTAGDMFNNLTMLVLFLVVVSIAGLLAGMIYYDMNAIEVALKTVDFTIPTENNASAVANNMTTFQDILGVVVYPILGLRSALPYLTYFMVFGFVIALGLTAYLSSKNPVFFVLHILFTIVLTYFTFYLSNMYVDLLTNPFINAMMIPFTIYNKLMIYLPQILFFTSLLFGVIAFINLIKPPNAAQNSYGTLNYGGDY